MTRVWTYGRAQRPRSSRDQIGRKAVQSKPAGWGKANPRVSKRLFDERPSGTFPCLDSNPLLIRDLESLSGPEPEVHLFRGPVLGG